MKLLSVQKDNPVSGDTDLTASYSFTHTTPGREGTQYEFQVDLKLDHRGVKGSLLINHAAPAKTVEAAFDKLAELLQRAADAIRDRPTATHQLPLAL